MSDAPVATEERVNEVKIEDVGPAKKRLTITIPAEAIKEKLEESIGTLMVETALPGFRKGRAPRKLVERRFGSAVRNETKSQLLADAYASALEDQTIKPVGEPDFVDKMDDVELEEGKPLTFAVDVEVVPRFDLPELEGIEIKKPVLEITDERIQTEIDALRMQNGEPEEVHGSIAAGHRLVGRAEVVREDEDDAFFETDETVVVVPGENDGGRGQVLGLLIDNLSGLLKGKKAGDDVIIETVGPEAHEREDIRGKQLTVRFHIKKAFEIIPADISTLTAMFGLPSEDILREQVKLSLEQRRDQEQAAAMREQVTDYLLDKVDFTLPQKLSEAQAGRALERTRMELLYRGLSPEEVETHLAEIRAASDEESAKRLKLFFILHKLADHFSVDVSEAEINGRISQIAASRNERPEKLRSTLVQSGQINQVASQIREHKAADRVVHQAKVIEISADEWNELVRAIRGGAAGAAAKKTTTKKTASSKKTTSGKTTSKKTSTKKSTTKKKTS